MTKPDRDINIWVTFTLYYDDDDLFSHDAWQVYRLMETWALHCWHGKITTEDKSRAIRVGYNSWEVNWWK